MNEIRKAMRFGLRPILLLVVFIVVAVGGVVLVRDQVGLADLPPWAPLIDGYYTTVQVAPDGRTGYLTSVPDNNIGVALPSDLKPLVQDKVTLLPVPVRGVTDRPFPQQFVYLKVQGATLQPTVEPATASVHEVDLPDGRVVFYSIRLADRLSIQFPTTTDREVVPDPDGTRVAITKRDRSGLWLYSMADHSRKQLVEISPDSSAQNLEFIGVAQPMWSRDGRWIYYVSSRNSPGKASLWRVDPQTGQEELVLDANKLGPIWLRGFGPNESLVFSADAGVYRSDADGKNPRLLLEGGLVESISPDGNIALVSTSTPGRVEMLSLNTGERSPISFPTGLQYGYHGASWSEDGTRVALYATGDDTPDRYLMVGQAQPEGWIFQVTQPPAGYMIDFSGPRSWFGNERVLVGVVNAESLRNNKPARPATWILSLNTAR